MKPFLCSAAFSQLPPVCATCLTIIEYVKSSLSSITGHANKTVCQLTLTCTSIYLLTCNTPSRDLNLLVVRSREIKWSKGSVERGLYCLPSFVYNPAANSGNGEWTRNENASQIQSTAAGEKQWEILYQRQGDWYYYGTYKSIKYSLISVKEVQKVCSRVSLFQVSYVYYNIIHAYDFCRWLLVVGTR